MVIMEPDEFDKFEKANKQKSSFDKVEMNDDGDDDMSDWDNTLLDGLDDL